MLTLTQADRRTEFLRTEAIAGVTTFFTMAYIVIVNPSILAAGGMDFGGVLTATVILSFAMTLLMGLYAKLPFAVAPGMGVNAYFAYTLILGQKIPWPVALGTIFWAGVIFVLVSVTPLRLMIANAIPKDLRTAAAAGIGIFLTFLGLKNAGFVVADPATFVRFGKPDAGMGLSFLGMAVLAFMTRRKSPFAYLAGIAVVTAAALALGLVHAPEHWISRPDFGSVLLKVEPLAALKPALLSAIIGILFTDLFDSISTFVGIAEANGILDERGEPRNLKEGLIVDAFATLGAALLGTSSGTAYIESSAGIEMGGRTGLTSVFTALCFLPCLFLAPVAGLVPAYATAPVLIFVGASMFRSVKRLSFDRLEDLLPAFLTIVLIPLTFSITQGILWGFIAHVGLYCVAGRRKEIAPMMWALAALAVALIAMQR